MEDIALRFPHLGEAIFDQVNDKALIVAKEEELSLCKEDFQSGMYLQMCADNVIDFKLFLRSSPATFKHSLLLASAKAAAALWRQHKRPPALNSLYILLHCPFRNIFTRSFLENFPQQVNLERIA